MAHITPGDHTVKEATKLLKGLTDEELAAVYDSELEDKGRRSLLDAISAARDGIREDAAAAEAEPEPESVSTTGKEVLVAGRRYLVMVRADGVTVSIPKS